MTDRAAAFLIAIAARTRLEGELSAASAAWNAIPGTGSSEMGLTPDAVKFSAPYRTARARYEGARKRLADCNTAMRKGFSRELRAYQRQRRALILR